MIGSFGLTALLLYSFFPFFLAWIWDIGAEWKEKNVWNPWTVGNQTAGYLTQFEVPTSSTGDKGSFILVTVSGNCIFAPFSFQVLTYSSNMCCLEKIHGAGHEVPAYRPMESLEMFTSFLSGKWRL